MTAKSMAIGMARQLVLAALASAATSAWACGGLFCDTSGAGGGPPLPVDQNGERIVFVVDSAAGLVCSHVQIQYRGAPESFAWVVPVPSVPTIGESDTDLFRQLDAVAALCATPDRSRRIPGPRPAVVS